MCEVVSTSAPPSERLPSRRAVAGSRVNSVRKNVGLKTARDGVEEGEGGQLARQLLNTADRWPGGERPRLKADGQLARQPELIEEDNRPVVRQEGAKSKEEEKEGGWNKEKRKSEMDASG